MKCASMVHFLVVVTKHWIYITLRIMTEFRNEPIIKIKKRNLAASLEGTLSTLPLLVAT